LRGGGWGFGVRRSVEFEMHTAIMRGWTGILCMGCFDVSFGVFRNQLQEFRSATADPSTSCVSLRSLRMTTLRFIQSIT
jgi:hypothetical protein